MENDPWPKDKCEKGKVIVTDRMKYWPAKEIAAGRETATYYRDKYGMNPRVVNNWVSRHRRGHGFSSSNGRPLILSSYMKKCLAAESVDSVYNMTKADFEAKVKQYAIQTIQERRDICESQIPVPSSRTIGRLKEELDIHEGKADSTTAARDVACSDVRNMVSFAAAQHMMMPIVDNRLIINLDATQFTVGDKKGRDTVMYRGKRSDQKGPLKAAPDESAKGITSFFIKYYLIMTSAGVSADPVYVIADENVPVDEFDHYVIPGLGTSTAPGNKGHVIFCHTRCANERFYTWLNTNIIVPFVFDLRKEYNLDDSRVVQKSWCV